MAEKKDSMKKKFTKKEGRSLFRKKRVRVSRLRTLLLAKRIFNLSSGVTGEGAGGGTERLESSFRPSSIEG